MDSNSTSSIKNYKDPAVGGVNYAAIVYGANPASVALSEYAATTSMFSNANSADCGGFTACEVLPVGCSGTYAGRATMTASTFALNMRQDIDAGYEETLCVKCQNALGSSVQHDNWTIE